MTHLIIHTVFVCQPIRGASNHFCRGQNTQGCIKTHSDSILDILAGLQTVPCQANVPGSCYHMWSRACESTFLRKTIFEAVRLWKTSVSKAVVETCTLSSYSSWRVLAILGAKSFGSCKTPHPQPPAMIYFLWQSLPFVQAASILRLSPRQAPHHTIDLDRFGREKWFIRVGDARRSDIA